MQAVSTTGWNRKGTNLRVCASAGYVGKRVGASPDEVAEEIVERYAAAETGPGIASSLGLKRWWVYELLQERTLSSGSGVLRSHGEAARLEQARRRTAEA